MKQIALLSVLLVLAGCASAGLGGGQRSAWRCAGGKSFSAQVSMSGVAVVSAGGRSFTLRHVRSASGARYSNGSVEYWERAGQATLTGAPGGPYTNCHRG